MPWAIFQGAVACIIPSALDDKHADAKYNYDKATFAFVRGCHFLLITIVSINRGWTDEWTDGRESPRLFIVFVYSLLSPLFSSSPP